MRHDGQLTWIWSKRQWKWLNESRRGADVKLHGDNRKEMSRRESGEDLVRRMKGSDLRLSAVDKGANRQQCRMKSDKDGIDSRTTGRKECDEEENDKRDKAEWHKCHQANLSCTLTLLFVYITHLLSLLLDLKPCGDGHQMGSMGANTQPPATIFPHLTASPISSHQIKPFQRGLSPESWSWASKEPSAGSIQRSRQRRCWEETAHNKAVDVLSTQLSFLDFLWNEISCSDAWALVWRSWTFTDLSTGRPFESKTLWCTPQSWTTFSERKSE